ncbi:hypothetical protein GCM10011611_03250 [Aliidongia dinghuensis]|uniref:Tyr recombinase domain-containing protein n=1 Tax=Aliidongia dinghuensis TaxID=1867774 RepID=A0A8J2YP57_9PROT|nr:hypothetical protein [Aliidongia dinghuensis]GGF01020.1 hypothetical protein GCM10011611_03250 [Aliidongia dinghuensis]
MLDAAVSSIEYDNSNVARLLAMYAVPGCVLATKPSFTSPVWFRESERDLQHNCWLLSSHDGSKKRNSEIETSFETVVDVNSVKLSDTSMVFDNVSKKIVVINSLSFGIAGPPVGSYEANKLSLNVDWLFRWRQGLGISFNSDIKFEHFRDFVERLKEAELLDLVPIASRLDTLVADSLAGNLSLPIYYVNKKPRIAWVPLAAKLGVPERALSNSVNFRLELLDRLEAFDNINATALAASLRCEGGETPAISRRSAGNINASLKPWQLITQLSQRGLLPHDPLTFNPFRDESRYVIASTIGTSGKRTTTLLPPDYFVLLASASTWVLEFSKAILRAYSLLRSARSSWRQARLRAELTPMLDAAARAGCPPLYFAWHIGRSRPSSEAVGRISIAEAVKLLMTACAIVIAGFSARRDGEIESLRRGCLIESRRGIYELSAYIEKTKRDLDLIPVPALVKSAITVLQKLSREARKFSGEPWLFQALKNEGEERPFIRFVPNDLLVRFAEINGLTPSEPGTTWFLKMHMFRRAFAILYYHGNRFASLDALSQFLRHFDPEMTRIYVNEILPGQIARLREEIEARVQMAFAAQTDEDRNWLADARDRLKELQGRGDIFNEVRCEYVVSRMLEMYDGKEKPIGLGAAGLYADLDAMVEKAAAQVRLGSRTNDPAAIRPPLIKQLHKYANDNFVEPVPGRAVQCRCKPGDEEDLKRAECLKEKRASRLFSSADQGEQPPDQRPDFNFSNLLVCLRCVHCAAFSENQLVIDDAVASVEVSAKRAATPSLKETATAKLHGLKDAVQSARAAVGGRA